MSRHAKNEKVSVLSEMSPIINLLSNILMIVSVVATCFIIIMHFGHVKTMYVVSNSMVPTFSKGDLLLVSETNKDIAPHDIISYNAEWAGGKSVTHRVLSVTDDTVIVKGDNNKYPDPPFDKSRVQGQIFAIYPKLGYLFNPKSIIAISVSALILTILSTKTSARDSKEKTKTREYYDKPMGERMARKYKKK